MKLKWPRGLEESRPGPQGMALCSWTALRTHRLHPFQGGCLAVWACSGFASLVASQGPRDAIGLLSVSVVGWCFRLSTLLTLLEGFPYNDFRT